MYCMMKQTQNFRRTYNLLMTGCRLNCDFKKLN
jgi:hypothetical protein